MNGKSTVFSSMRSSALYSYSHELYVFHQYKNFTHQNLRNIYEWTIFIESSIGSIVQTRSSPVKYFSCELFASCKCLDFRIVWHMAKGERVFGVYFIQYKTVPYVYVIYGGYSLRYKWNEVYFSHTSKLFHAISKYKWNLNTAPPAPPQQCQQKQCDTNMNS